MIYLSVLYKGIWKGYLQTKLD